MFSTIVQSLKYFFQVAGHMANHLKVWLAIWQSWLAIKQNNKGNFKHENYEKLGIRQSHCSGMLNVLALYQIDFLSQIQCLY